MTVRTWFRILRRSAWEGSLPEVTLYCRGSWQSPLGPRVQLWALTDYQKVIDNPNLARPPIDVIREDMATYWRRLGLSDAP